MQPAVSRLVQNFAGTSTVELADHICAGSPLIPDIQIALDLNHSELTVALKNLFNALRLLRLCLLLRRQSLRLRHCFYSIRRCRCASSSPLNEHGRSAEQSSRSKSSCCLLHHLASSPTPYAAVVIDLVQ